MSTQVETIHAGSNRKIRPVLIILGLFVVLLLGTAVVATMLGNSSSGEVITEDLSAPLGKGTSATINLQRYSGDITIAALNGNEPVLAVGKLPYLDNQNLTSAVDTSSSLAVLTLKTSTKQTGFRLPWVGCSDETEWQIQLNPTLPSDLTAYSGGGILKLNLAGMAITRLSAETGGGNVEVVLPDNARNLNAIAKTGAGNVTVEIGNSLVGSNAISASSGAGNVIVRLPGSLAALIHVTGGAGTAQIDPQFIKIDERTYQSPGYNQAADRVEMTVSSGAGTVSVSTKE